MMMHCSVREAMRRISSREFSEWMALYRIEPWGSECDDLRWARLQCLLSNVYRAEGVQRFTLADFQLCERTVEPPQSDEDVAAALMAWAASEVKAQKNG